MIQFEFPRIFTCLSLCLAIATTGCTSLNSTYMLPPKIQKVAVASNNEAAISGAIQALGEKGYATVDIGLQERLSSTGYPDILSACHQEGVDALLFIDITNISSNTIRNNYGSTTYYGANATASLVDVENSRTLWSDDNHARVSPVLMLIALPVLLFMPCPDTTNPTSVVMEAGRQIASRMPSRSY